jgi:xanthosine utilization system XapX-like protein
MPATPRQLWSLRIALVVMLVGTFLAVRAPRPPHLKALGVCSTLFAAAVVFVALRQSSSRD